MTNIKLPTVKLLKSHIAESYRTLRTNIQFSSLDNNIRTIVITSSGPSEGKTTVSCNLAVATAQTGKRTLLLDCDMRSPKIHKVFGISNQTGLSDLLIGNTNYYEAVVKTEIENLYVFPSGTIPPNPAELLSSERMKKFMDAIFENYDCIIIDTPPILMVTDAQILGKYADGCLLVIASGQTERNAVLKAKELLNIVDAKIIGAVINKFETKGKGNYRYYSNYSERTRRKEERKSKRGISSGKSPKEITLS